ncbi:MAG: CpsD/CapB family tyrosine-protein kinase [Ruminococcaceae bacterium]|nr:CpsD/CapB family tyrosine-protein kinase [Oscillospiraceae bacterium]
MSGLFGKHTKSNKKRSDAKKRATIAEDRKHILTSKSGFYLREAYKTLRTNVNFALADTEGCKVIIVMSAMQSEGKSLTALNLAISIAQTEAKVLIIDCDLRRPKLHRLLGASTNVGLSNLLMDLKNLNVTINKIESLGISVLLSGDIPPNPSELLASGRMQTLITALRSNFDYIIIDTPPVNLVIDSVVLAPLTDGVLFVVKADQSERGAVMHAMEQMEYAKAKVLGYVFNGMNSESGSGYGKYRYSKYGRYGYGYGYGHHTKSDPSESAPDNSNHETDE